MKDRVLAPGAVGLVELLDGVLQVAEVMVTAHAGVDADAVTHGKELNHATKSRRGGIAILP